MSFEIVVRPASAVPVLKNSQQPPAVESADDEAYIGWGTGSLTLATRNEVYDGFYGSGGGIGDDFGDYPVPPPEPDPEEPQLIWDEVSRVTHTVRITQSGKPENYVDVEVIDQMTFFFLGKYHLFRFKNPR